MPIEIGLHYKQSLLTDEEVEEIKSKFPADQSELHFEKELGGSVSFP